MTIDEVFPCWDNKINENLFSELKVCIDDNVPANEIRTMVKPNMPVGYITAPYIIHYSSPVFLKGIIKIGNIDYQIKLNNIFWKRDKRYPFIKIISRLRKV